MEALGASDVSTEQEEPDDRYQAIVESWANALVALDIEVKGVWLIDFDCGSGYYCWRWPEAGLQFFHDYDSGFGGRVELN